MPRLDSLLTASLLSLALAFGTGCGDTSTPAPVPPPAYPTIASFVAGTGSITKGTSTQLTAVFANGTGTLSPGGSIASGTPVTVTPTSTTVYTLAVTNSANKTVTSEVQVTVVAAPAVKSFTAAQTPLAAGDTTLITAFFEGGPGTIDNGVGPVTSGVGVKVTPASSTTYTLTVSNTLGSSATQPLTVAIAAAVPAKVSGGSLFAQDRVHPGDDLDLASFASAAAPAPTVAWTLGAGTVNGASNAPLLSYKAPATPGLFSLSAAVLGAAGASTNLTQPVEAVVNASLMDPRDTRQRAAAAAVLADGRVLVTGTLDVYVLDYSFVPNEATPPVTQSWSGATAGGDLYDPISGTWKPVGSMATPRLSHTMTLLPNGKILVAGGISLASKDGQLAKCELYDPLTRTFSPAAAMAVHRASHTATLLPNGKVLVAGGVSLGSVKTLQAELYDPATDSWSGAGTTTAHDTGAAALLPNGKVLLAGGAGSTGAELYDPAANAWAAAASPVVAGQAGVAAVLLPGGKVLVSVGGTSSSTELYDPAANTWSAAASRSVSGTGTVRLALVSGGLVLAVGSTPSATPELYDPSTNTWRAAKRMRAARGTLAGLVTLPDGKALALGGGQDVAGPETYDPATDSWSTGGSAVFARTLHKAILLADGRVLVAGGSTTQAEVYHPVTGWSSAGNMLQARQWHGAVRLRDGRVLVCGGPGATAELYDPATNSWSAAASMAFARDALTLTLLPDGRALAVGGGNTNLGNLDSAEIYDPVANRWSPAASITGGRRKHSATLLPNGKVLVAGGVSRIGAVDTAQLYDPAKDSWTPAGTMTNVRQYQTATVLPNGKVLVVGGADTFNSLSTTEFYDPATNSWSSGNPLVAATRRHTATLLPDGRVVVLGGLDADPAASPFIPNNASRFNAQIYDPVTERWSAGGKLLVPRADHDATLLGNGKVLVTGGSFVQMRYVQVGTSNWYQVFSDYHPLSAAELWK